MDKRTLSEDTFGHYMKAEMIAFFSYKIIVEENLKNEYVDLVATSFGEMSYFPDYCVEDYARAKMILDKDYNVDMFSLPFKDQKLKKQVQDYVLENYEIFNISI